MAAKLTSLAQLKESLVKANRKIAEILGAVSDAISEVNDAKLDTAGGKMTGYIDWGNIGRGCSWTCCNGDIYNLRAWSEDNVFQLTRQNSDTGLEEYGVITIFGNGSITLQSKSFLEAITLGGNGYLAMYKEGDIYITTSSVSPASIYGGTWEQIAQDRVLMGVNSSHLAGTTAEAGLPNITGTVYEFGNRSGPNNVTGAFSKVDTMERIPTVGEILSGYASTSVWDMDASRSSSVYGKSTTVQPAAYYVYIWRRVA